MNNQSDWVNRDNISDWLNRTNYTAEERRIICAQIMSEAQYWDSTQYQRMMHDSTKRPWVGLTDEEISAITSKVIGFNSCAGWEEDYARAIEQALKEKNT
jgi:hypothetical protein